MFLTVCRVCLACDVSHSIRDVQLKETYERLAGAKFYSVDEMPVNLCHFCYWQLQKYCNLSVQARSSHKILKEAIKFGDKVGLQYIQNVPKKCHLTISTIKTLSLDGSRKRKSFQNSFKKKVKKIESEFLNDSWKPLPTNTQNLKSTMKNSSPSSSELFLASNPELIIKKQKKPEDLKVEKVQNIHIEMETEHNENEKLSPNKIQPTENNAQSDPQMTEEYLDVYYDSYDDDDETLNQMKTGFESKKIFSNEKYRAEHSNLKVSNLKETNNGTQISGTKEEKKDTHGFNQSGVQVFRPVADTSPDIQNLDMVAEFLEIETDPDLSTNIIVNNQDNHVAVYQMEEKIDENLDHQDTHNNNTRSETLSIQNVSENCEVETEKDSQSKNNHGTINSASKFHSTAVLENVTDELIYKCSFCNKLYTTKQKLDEHTQGHTSSKVKKVTCKECGQKFICAFDLAGHIRKHTNERPFVCEICGKTFRIRGSLDGHLDRHLKPKHVCNICNKSFTTKGYVYNYHMNSHFNLRPYVCHICQSAFHQKGSLWQHIRCVHQGIKRYACDICSVKFDSKSHLGRHKMTHSGVKAFSCDYCNMNFTTKSTMKRHVTLYCKMK